MKQYTLPKYISIVIYLFLFSMIFFSLFIKGMWSCHRPIVITEQGLDRLKSGQIVRLEMDSFVINDHGIDQWLGMKEKYFEYAIPVGERFVLVGLYESNTLQHLKSYTNGRGTPMTIMGRVMPVNQIHEELYRIILGSRYDQLQQRYIVFQVTEEELTKKSLRCIGIAGIFALIAMVLLFGMGGIYSAKEKPFEESAIYKEYQFKVRYHLEDYLKKEKNNIDEMRKQQALAPKRLLWYVFVCVMSVAFFIFCIRNCSDHVMLVYPMIFGIFVLWAGLRRIGGTLLDMDFKASRQIAKKFALNTLPIRIEQTSILIGLLNRRILEKVDCENED